MGVELDLDRRALRIGEASNIPLAAQFVTVVGGSRRREEAIDLDHQGYPHPLDFGYTAGRSASRLSRMTSTK